MSKIPTNILFLNIPNDAVALMAINSVRHILDRLLNTGQITEMELLTSGMINTPIHYQRSVQPVGYVSYWEGGEVTAVEKQGIDVVLIGHEKLPPPDPDTAVAFYEKHLARKHKGLDRLADMLQQLGFQPISDAVWELKNDDVHLLAHIMDRVAILDGDPRVSCLYANLLYPIHPDDIKIINEAIDYRLHNKPQIQRQHTPQCGTMYRGCSPECTFHDSEVVE